MEVDILAFIATTLHSSSYCFFTYYLHKTVRQND